MSSTRKKFNQLPIELWLIPAGAGLLFLLILLGEKGLLFASIRVVRAALGIIYGLLVPGYLLQLSLYPRHEDLTWDGKLALSFGLSIAILASLALILNLFPRGLSLWPLTSTWIGLILVLDGLALLKQTRVDRDSRSRLFGKFSPREVWENIDHSGRKLLILLSLSLLLSIGAGIGLAILPIHGSSFTEFYILGEEKKAESYPYIVVVDQPVSITVGINNREGMEMLYTLEAEDASGVIGLTSPIILQDGESIEFQFTITPRAPGEGVPIHFYLYCSGATEPYRETYLIADVVREVEFR